MDGEQFKVLIIDDEKPHAEAVAESLQRVGYECTIVTSGKAGAARIDEDDFDIILTDLRMPDMDGLAILRKAKQANPSTEVVVITGHGDVKTAVEAIKQGAANYLTKPLDMGELRAVVDKAADTTQFSIYVAGLSNGWTVDDKGVVRRKTLQLNFRRFTDALHQSSQDIKFVPPTEWIYRATTLKAPAKPGEATAPKDGDK